MQLEQCHGQLLSGMALWEGCRVPQPGLSARPPRLCCVWNSAGRQCGAHQAVKRERKLATDSSRGTRWVASTRLWVLLGSATSASCRRTATWSSLQALAWL